MRAAFLLSGVVGKFYTNKQGYEWSGDVDFRIGHHFFKKHIFDVNDTVDVFIHCWDTQYEKQLTELYQPKKSKFQEQIQFDNEIMRGNFIESRWYSTKQVTELKKNMKKENDFTYDVVMSCRFDVGFFEDLVFNDVMEDPNAMYIAKTNPPNPQKPTICDLWHFSSSKNMDIINSFHDHWKELGRGTPHSDLYMWPTKNNIDIYMIDKFQDSEKGNGNTDVIRCVFDDCEYKGDNFPGVDKLKRLDRYPRGTRV